MSVLVADIARSVAPHSSQRAAVLVLQVAAVPKTAVGAVPKTAVGAVPKTAIGTHSERRFPAPSSKLCQIWLRH